MPYFSFILKDSLLDSKLGVLGNKNTLLKKNIKYYCKNTSVWKHLNSSKFKEILEYISIEKHQKFDSNIKNVIFCLPPKIGLGDSIEYALAIKAIEKANIFKNFSIAFSSKYSEILTKTLGFKNIFPEFLTDKNIKKYNNFFHFTSEIYSIKNQKYNRSNIEDQILKYFKTKPYRKKFHNKNVKPKIISIFPISKSPIRTLSVELLNNLINFLLEKNFIIHLVLDRDSIISDEVQNGIKNNLIKIYIPETLNKLNSYIKKIEFGIFCDSGPLHLSKIYQKKGLIISTSVNAVKLISYKDKLLLYNSKYKSKFCEAPCGLTNIVNYKNNYGCYDSLSINKTAIMKKENYHLLNRGNLSNSYKYYMNNPVSCVRSVSFDDIKKILKKAINIKI